MGDTPTNGIDEEATLAGTAAAQPPASVEVLAPGQTVARYEIRSRIGSGAMGTVYRAWDPRLKRDVAVKVVRPRSGSGEAMRRVLKEARAAARLNHPSIVKVNHVGQLGPAAFIVMEFVEGQTLTGWLAKHEPGVGEILRIFRSIGHALAAAHRAGVVHRDLKPDNVMITARGDVRVLDFGIAGSLVVTGEDTEDDGGVALSQTSAGVGTPAYMAPEQHLHAPTDARTDQFAFALCLYEALNGVRPFEGKTMAELATSVVGGAIRGGPKPRGGRRVNAAILRALSASPGQRFDDMDSMLAAMEPTTVRWLWPVAGGAVAVAAVGVAFGIGARPGPDPLAECDQTAVAIDTVWDSDRAQSIAQAFEEPKLAYARPVWQRMRQHVEQYVADWKETRVSACAIERTDPGRGRAVARCLARYRESLDGLLERAAADPRRAALGGVDSLLDLGSPISCMARSSTVLIPPPELEVEVERVRTELWRLGKAASSPEFPDDYAPRLERLRKDAHATGYPPLLTLLDLTEGDVCWGLQDFECAIDKYSAAAQAAETRGDYQSAARAFSSLAWVAGVDGTDYDSAARWLRHADAAVDRLDNPLELRMRVLGDGAIVLKNIGDHDGAIRRLEQVVEDLDSRGVTHSFNYYNVLANLASIYLAKGELEKAEALVDKAVSRGLEEHSPEHPAVAVPLSVRGQVLMKRRQYEAAFGVFSEVSEVCSVSFGPDHPNTLEADANLATAAQALGKIDQAEQLYQRVLEARDKMSPDAVAQVFSGLASIAVLRGEAGEGLRLYERAVADLGRTAGPEHQTLVAPLLGISSTQRSLRAFDRAEAAATQALHNARLAFGPSAPQTEDALLELALTAEARGDHDKATSLAAEAQSIAKQTARVFERDDELGFLRARLRWHRGEQDQAIDDARALRETARPQTAAKIDAWLAGTKR